MFKALLISLNEGQSFKNVKVLESTDFDEYEVPRLFGDLTSCIYADKKWVILHSWAIRLIQLDKKYVKCSRCLHSQRLVLDGNTSFSPATIIQASELSEYGYPQYFDTTDDLGGQCTFSCSEGTFITHATNVAYLIYDDKQSGVMVPQVLLKSKK